MNNKMTSQEIWDYSKSLCKCYECTKKSYPRPEGAPSNLSIRSSNTNPDYYSCYNVRPFRSDIEPRIERRKTSINPQMITSKFAKDFYKVDNSKVQCANNSGTTYNPNNNCIDTFTQKSCSKVQYGSMDPRLVSTGHLGQVQTLDSVPLDTRTKLNTLLDDESLDKYGQNYTTYSDIKGGNIMYYIDHEIQDPLFYPNYVIPVRVNGIVYQDPMGAYKPHYQRQSIKCRNVLDPSVNGYNGGLSWIEDSMEQREDIMNRQMAVQNQSRWSPRWYA